MDWTRVRVMTLSKCRLLSCQISRARLGLQIQLSLQNRGHMGITLGRESFSGRLSDCSVERSRLQLFECAHLLSEYFSLCLPGLFG